MICRYLQIGFILRYLSQRIQCGRFISFWESSQPKKTSLKSFSVFQVVLPPTTFMCWNRMKQFELGSLSDFYPFFTYFFGGWGEVLWTHGPSVVIIGLDQQRGETTDEGEDWKIRFCQQNWHDWKNHSVACFMTTMMIWTIRAILISTCNSRFFSSHSSMIARNNGANDPINIVLWNGLWLKMTPLFASPSWRKAKLCVNWMDVLFNSHWNLSSW